jgi:hypothetical protein
VRSKMPVVGRRKRKLQNRRSPHCENGDSPVLDGKRQASFSIRSRAASRIALRSIDCSFPGAPVVKQAASSHEEKPIGRNNGSRILESCCPCQELGKLCEETSPLEEAGAILVIVLRSRGNSKESLQTDSAVSLG